MIGREGGGIERPFSYLLFHWAKQNEMKNFRDTDVAAADDRQRAVDREREMELQMEVVTDHDPRAESRLQVGCIKSKSYQRIRTMVAY